MQEASGRIFMAKCTHAFSTGVSGDGTWMKGGHASQFGNVSVTSCETGEVLDFEIMSKHCSSCKFHFHMRNLMSGFRNTKIQKQCQINYEGSSGSMERAAILILFKRSIKKLKLRYTSLLGDEDTKSIEEINLNQPYGPRVTETKEECVVT